MAGIIDSKDIQNIVLEHILKIRQLEDETCKVLKERVENIITRLLLKVNQNLKSAQGLKQYDCLYFQTEELKEKYGQFLEVLDDQQDNITDETIRGIFHGLRRMIVSFLDAMPSRDDNPITYERMVLVSAAVLKIKQYWFDQLEKQFHSCHIDSGINQEKLMDYMTKQAWDFFADSINSAVEILRDSMEMMREFEEGHRYENQMREQKKRLDALVMPQMPLIMNQASSEKEKAACQVLLTILDQSYGLIDLAIEALEEKVVLDQDIDEICNMSMVDGLLDDYIFHDGHQILKLFKGANQLREASHQALRQVVEPELDNRCSQCKDKIQRQTAGYKQLSNQFIGLFKEAVKELKEIPCELRTEAGQAITEGIVSTMSLKLDTIVERDAAYREGIDQLGDEMFELLMEQKRLLKGRTEEILDDIITGTDKVIHKSSKGFLDSLKFVSEKHFQYHMAYLKNDLLFEVRTFEELIEHSLKKLIELEQDKVAPITEVMLATMEKSRDCLAGHGIELIIPKPHDSFDPKSHEVLMAEKAEGYVKGEVIRCLNIGYQWDYYVIIRASVLAAR